MARLESAGLHYCIINSVHLNWGYGISQSEDFFFLALSFSLLIPPSCHTEQEAEH